MNIKRQPRSRPYSQASDDSQVTAVQPLTAMVTETTSSPLDRSAMIHKVKQGLQVGSLALLEKELQISQKDLGRLLAISPSTMTRRKRIGVLSPEESDRVVRLAQIRDATVELFEGDANAALIWLTTAQGMFEGETPLQRAATELGAKDVYDLIARLEYGVFS